MSQLCKCIYNFYPALCLLTAVVEGIKDDPFSYVNDILVNTMYIPFNNKDSTVSLY